MPNPCMIGGSTGVAANAVATTADATVTFTAYKKMRLRRLISSCSSAAGGVLSGLFLTSLIIDGTNYVGGSGTGFGVPLECFFSTSTVNPVFDIEISKDSTFTAIVHNGSSVTQDFNLAAIGYTA